MAASTSTDGGETWVSTEAPPVPTGACAVGDPAVAVDLAGRQYYALLLERPCGRSRLSHVVVSIRPGAQAAWPMPRPIAPLAEARDDAPAIAVDLSSASSHRGRVFAVWVRRLGQFLDSIVVSHSDDGGRTWSAPARVNDVNGYFLWPTIALGGDGFVYVTWEDVGSLSIRIDRSTDGGQQFGPDLLVASERALVTPRCRFAGLRIPAQPTRCVHPRPVVSVDRSDGRFRGRVYVTYADISADRAENVFVSAFDRQLRPLLGYRIGFHPYRVNPDGQVPSDQFLPVSTVDEADGRLWVCFYDTSGDRRRVRTHFSCTASSDGGVTWAKPVAVSSAPSNETRKGADNGRSGLQYGDYEALAVVGGAAHPMWTDSRDLATLREEIYTTTLTADDLR